MMFAKQQSKQPHDSLQGLGGAGNGALRLLFFRKVDA
jgi:hypothetical protein